LLGSDLLKVSPMSRSRLLAVFVAGCALFALPGVAGAASLRAQCSVAGVRATLRADDTALLEGDGKPAVCC
jgi:hypothetical protein